MLLRYGKQPLVRGNREGRPRQRSKTPLLVTARRCWMKRNSCSQRAISSIALSVAEKNSLPPRKVAKISPTDLRSNTNFDHGDENLLKMENAVPQLEQLRLGRPCSCNPPSDLNSVTLSKHILLARHQHQESKVATSLILHPDGQRENPIPR